MYSGSVAPDWVGGERAVQHWLEVRPIHCLELVVIRIAIVEWGKLYTEGELVSAHPMLHILTMEVNLEERG